jgi:single-strand DNA-binding protein
MASLNKVFLIGNLTRDPELRYIPSGSAVTTFTIAVNRVYTQQGEKKEEVSYIRVVVWAKMAETCGEYLSKGSPVFVEGRIQSRSWETPQGEKRSTVEVIAERVQFLGKTKGSKQDLPAPDAETPDVHQGGPQDEGVPF